MREISRVGGRKAGLDVGINLRLRDIETKQNSSINFVHFFLDVSGEMMMLVSHGGCLGHGPGSFV